MSFTYVAFFLYSETEPTSGTPTEVLNDTVNSSAPNNLSSELSDLGCANSQLTAPVTSSLTSGLIRERSLLQKHSLSSSQKEPAITSTPKKSKSTMNKSMDDFSVRTTLADKHKLDHCIADMVYATNSSFSIVEHPKFKTMVESLRPGYKPPSRKDIAGKLLDDVYEIETTKCKNALAGKTVCMSLDGWTNVSNEPIICSSVTAQSGTCDAEGYLVDTIDTSGHPHTAEYLHRVAKDSIEKAETQFGCKIGSFVTDNAANVKKMRDELMKDDDSMICYGCSAHLLNLLAKDLEVDTIKGHIVKYFKYNHAASAAYKSAGGKGLVIP